jgi:hypothetical protein
MQLRTLNVCSAAPEKLFFNSGFVSEDVPLDLIVAQFRAFAAATPASRKNPGHWPFLLRLVDIKKAALATAHDVDNGLPAIPWEDYFLLLVRSLPIAAMHNRLRWIQDLAWDVSYITLKIGTSVFSDGFYLQVIAALEPVWPLHLWEKYLRLHVAEAIVGATGLIPVVSSIAAGYF